MVLIEITLTFITLWVITRVYNRIRKNNKIQNYKAPKPVNDGIKIGKSAYMIYNDIIFVNTLRVENGIVFYTYENDFPAVGEQQDAVIDFLEMFVINFRNPRLDNFIP